MRRLSVIFLLCIVVLNFGCATRQKTSLSEGATAQRLLTYSIEKWVSKLSEDDFAVLAKQPVFLSVNFIIDSALLRYAEQVLKFSLQQKYQIQWVKNESDAVYKLSFFFNSLGTDSDYKGLSIPFIDITGGETGRIDLLALDQFHAITEGYYYIEGRSDNSLTRSEKTIVRIRSDSLSTPVISIPISNLK
jgi:acid phosphatase class B